MIVISSDETESPQDVIKRWKQEGLLSDDKPESVEEILERWSKGGLIEE